MSDSSSTPVAPATDVEMTSEDSQEEVPAYVLGQKHVPAARFENQATMEELIYGRTFQPFVVSLRKPDGGRKTYVSIVGELIMQDQRTVETALMIISPTRVVRVAPRDIFSIDCRLLFPRGYGRRARNGRIRFSVRAIMQRYWDTLPSEDAGPA